MKIEVWPTTRPVPYARNARQIPQQAIDKVAASIKEFGFRQPIVVDGEGVIIAGHTRLLAAQKLDLDKVPVHVATGLSDAQVKAYRLSDNRTHEEAVWDIDLLGIELQELDGLDFDMELTGFDPLQITGAIAKAESTAAGLTDEDEVPEVSERAVTALGDTWLLGRHRLRCGDSTAATDVEALLAGVEPLLMVTDPPYGVDYDPDWRNRADRADGTPYGARTIGQVQNDGNADWREAWALFPGDVAYVWHASWYVSNVQQSLEAAGFTIRNQVIWAKARFAISRGDYHWQHEPCWYAVRKSGKGHWQGDRTQSTLWQIEHRKSETGHSTQKPVECMRRPIVNNSAPGQPVYDPFLGSGTTVIAAETEGRACLGMEVDPAYCDVAVKRWQAFTGDAATLEGDGRTFDEVAHERDKETRAA